MMDIIALIFLARNIGNLAVQKGLSPGQWKMYTILAWFGAELVGVVIGVLMFGIEEGILPAILLGVGFAVMSYFTVRSVLQKKPDPIEEDINRIGVNDLRP